MNFQEVERWNAVSYGSAIKIRKNWILLGVSIICLITPFTNWMIPIFAVKLKDVVVRY